MDVQSAALAENAAETCANLKQELVEAKDALEKQVEESAQQMAVKTDEVQNLHEVMNTLKEQSGEVQHTRCFKNSVTPDSTELSVMHPNVP